MTDLLEQAFEQASKLSEQQQDSIAKWLLEELESESRWEQAFASSVPLLHSLANKAMEEMEAGIALPLDPETL